MEELSLLEKAIYRFSEGRIWPVDLPGVRQGWIKFLKDDRIDEKLALRILQERINVYFNDQ